MSTVLSLSGPPGGGNYASKGFRIFLNVESKNGSFVLAEGGTMRAIILGLERFILR
jgi:hypothetical protein